MCFIYSLVFIILFLEDEYAKASWIVRREALLPDSLSFSSHTVNLTHEDFLLRWEKTAEILISWLCL